MHTTHKYVYSGRVYEWVYTVDMDTGRNTSQTNEQFILFNIG